MSTQEDEAKKRAEAKARRSSGYASDEEEEEDEAEEKVEVEKRLTTEEDLIEKINSKNKEIEKINDLIVKARTDRNKAYEGKLLLQLSNAKNDLSILQRRLNNERDLTPRKATVKLGDVMGGMMGKADTAKLNKDAKELKEAEDVLKSLQDEIARMREDEKDGFGDPLAIQDKETEIKTQQAYIETLKEQIANKAKGIGASKGGAMSGKRHNDIFARAKALGAKMGGEPEVKEENELQEEEEIDVTSTEFDKEVMLKVFNNRTLDKIMDTYHITPNRMMELVNAIIRPDIDIETFVNEEINDLPPGAEEMFRIIHDIYHGVPVPTSSTVKEYDDKGQYLTLNNSVPGKVIYEEWLPRLAKMISQEPDVKKEGEKKRGMDEPALLTKDQFEIELVKTFDVPRLKDFMTANGITAERMLPLVDAVRNPGTNLENFIRDQGLSRTPSEQLFRTAHDLYHATPAPTSEMIKPYFNAGIYEPEDFFTRTGGVVKRFIDLQWVPQLTTMRDEERRLAGGGPKEDAEAERLAREAAERLARLAEEAKRHAEAELARLEVERLRDEERAREAARIEAEEHAELLAALAAAAGLAAEAERHAEELARIEDARREAARHAAELARIEAARLEAERLRAEEAAAREAARLAEIARAADAKRAAEEDFKRLPPPSSGGTRIKRR